MALHSSAGDRKRQVAVVVASACLLLACVLLAHSFGLITLWGGMPAAPKMTVAEESRVRQLTSDAAAQRAQNEAKGRVKTVGGN